MGNLFAVNVAANEMSLPEPKVTADRGRIGKSA